MSRKVMRFAILLAYCLFLFYRFNLAAASVMLQTIPTRTPTPSSAPPTAPPTSIPPPARATSIPPTATSTPTAPVVTATGTSATSSDGILPTAMLCGDPPTAETLNIANVRQGPGLNYAVQTTLPYLAVRRIVGRASDTAWWLIELDQEQTGWVADEVVSIQGYIGNVPLATPPPINGETPTPASAWNPTPNPLCTATPILTITPRPLFDTASTEVAIIVPLATETQAATPTAELPLSVTPAQLSATAAPTNETSVAVVATTGSVVASIGSDAIPTPTLAGLADEESPRSFGFLPIATLSLLVIGILLTMWRRIASGLR